MMNDTHIAAIMPIFDCLLTHLFTLLILCCISVTVPWSCFHLFIIRCSLHFMFLFFFLRMKNYYYCITVLYTVQMTMFK